MSKDDAGKRDRANLQGEIDSSVLYRVLAEAETNPQLVQVYERLAAIEESHAEFWSRHLERIGGTIPKRRPGWPTRFLVWPAHRFGPDSVPPLINTLEPGLHQVAIGAAAGLTFGIGRLIGAGFSP